MGRSAKRKSQVFENKASDQSNDDEEFPIRNTSYVRRHIPVKDWGIKFTGEPGADVGVMSFLHDVETLRVARRYSDDDLMAEAMDLFSGPALIWYRSVGSKLKTWKELVASLRQYFEPKSYTRQLWQEIRSRTQGKNEPVGIYIAVMQNYFDRLPVQPPESEKVDLVRSNLLPYLVRALALVPTPSLSDLLNVTRELEGTEMLAVAPRADAPPRRNLLHPELSYSERRRETARIADTVHTQGQRHRTWTQQTPQYNASVYPNRTRNDNPVRCWNCDAPGHTFRFCIEEQKVFCVGCGQKGSAKKNCRNCSGNANAGRKQTGYQARFQDQRRSNPNGNAKNGSRK